MRQRCRRRARGVKRSAKLIGWEPVTVPAGTFRALHIQNAENKSDT